MLILVMIVIVIVTESESRFMKYYESNKNNTGLVTIIKKLYIGEKY